MLSLFRRIKVFKKNARDILRERFISIIIANLLLISMSFGFLQILVMLLTLLGDALQGPFHHAITLFAAAFFLIVVCPIFYGYLKWMQGLCADNPSEISGIFDVFSSKTEISKAFRCFSAFFWWSVLTIGAIALLLFLKDSLNEILMHCFSDFDVLFGFFGAATAIIVGFPVVLTAIVSLYFLIRIICAVFIFMASTEDTSLLMCFAASKAVLKGKKLEFVIINFSFIGWYFLSFFTAGILFVSFALPYHVLTVCGFLCYACIQHGVISQSALLQGNDELEENDKAEETPLDMAG